MNETKMNEKIIIQGDFHKLFWLIPIAISAIALIVWLVIVPELAGVNSSEFDISGIICIPLIVASFTLLFITNGCSITVTDKRVYGKASFGKRVDLPLDSISAVASRTFLSCIYVSTSSGNISFFLAKNYAQIHRAINDLLIARQSKPAVTSGDSPSDELRKYKELLDSGIITQEEFDAKKKQLLGL